MKGSYARRKLEKYGELVHTFRDVWQCDVRKSGWVVSVYVNDTNSVTGFSVHYRGGKDTISLNRGLSRGMYTIPTLLSFTLDQVFAPVKITRPLGLLLNLELSIRHDAKTLRASGLIRVFSIHHVDENTGNITWACDHPEVIGMMETIILGHTCPMNAFIDCLGEHWPEGDFQRLYDALTDASRRFVNVNCNDWPKDWPEMTKDEIIDHFGFGEDGFQRLLKLVAIKPVGAIVKGEGTVLATSLLPEQIR